MKFGVTLIFAFLNIYLICGHPPGWDFESEQDDQHEKDDFDDDQDDWKEELGLDDDGDHFDDKHVPSMKDPKLRFKECSYTFPDNFLFGSASSAFQSEGAWNIDGKTPSIWDNAIHNGELKVVDNSNADLATNSYYLYREDVQNLKKIGLNYYRFSMSWPRILPNGDRSVINEKGIEFYKNLINELIRRGIEPVVTMYHWDLPEKLNDLGGWTNPLILHYMVDYADLLFETFGDQVKYWITINEPFHICYQGYGIGTHAPLISQSGVLDYICGHNILLTHAAIYHLYQEKYNNKFKAKISMSLNCNFGFPNNTKSSTDIAAAERYMEFTCDWFAHPLYSEKGGYPPKMVRIVNQNSENEGRTWSRLPHMTEETKRYIQGTSNFFALNYYTSRDIASADYDPSITSFENDQGIIEFLDESIPHVKWVYYRPDGLLELLKRLNRQYGVEVMITENGVIDSPDDKSPINDDGRVEYLREHLNAILIAIHEEKCIVTGHTTWSLMDLFEFIDGYTSPFGLFHVDRDSLKRIPKKSARFLKEVIQTRKVPEKF